MRWLDPGFLAAAVPHFADPTVGRGAGPRAAGRRRRGRRHRRPRAAPQPRGPVPGRGAPVADRGDERGDLGARRRGRALPAQRPSRTSPCRPVPTARCSPTRFFAYKEDVDLAWRLRRRRWVTMLRAAGRCHPRAGGPDHAERPAGLAWRAGAELSRLADRNGFVNHRLMQVRVEDLRSLRRDLWPWLRARGGSMAPAPAAGAAARSGPSPGCCAACPARCGPAGRSPVARSSSTTSAGSASPPLVPGQAGQERAVAGDDAIGHHVPVEGLGPLEAGGRRDGPGVGVGQQPGDRTGQRIDVAGRHERGGARRRSPAPKGCRRPPRAGRTAWPPGRASRSPRPRSGARGAARPGTARRAGGPTRRRAAAPASRGPTGPEVRVDRRRVPAVGPGDQERRRPGGRRPTASARRWRLLRGVSDPTPRR